MAARRLAISSLLCEDDSSDTAPTAGPSSSSPALPFPAHPQSRPFDPYPSSFNSYSRSPENPGRHVSSSSIVSLDAYTQESAYTSTSSRRPASPQSYPNTGSPSIPSLPHLRRYSYDHDPHSPEELSRPGSQNSDYPTRRHLQLNYDYTRHHSSRQQPSIAEPAHTPLLNYDYTSARPTSSRSGTSGSPPAQFNYAPQSLHSQPLAPSLSPVNVYHRQLSRSPILPVQRPPASPVSSYNIQPTYIPPQATRSPYALSPAFPTSHHTPASPASPYQLAQLSPVLTRPTLSSLITHSPPLSRGSHSHPSNTMSTPLSARAEGFGPLEALVQAATEERRRLSGEMVPPGEQPRRHSGMSDASGHGGPRSARVSPVLERGSRNEQSQLPFSYPPSYSSSHSGPVSTSPVISSTRLLHDDYPPHAAPSRISLDGEPPLKRRRSSGETMASRSPVIPVQPPPSVPSHVEFIKSLEKKRSSEAVVATPIPEVVMKASPVVAAANPSLPVPAMFSVGDTSRGVVIIKEKRAESVALNKDPVERPSEVVVPSAEGAPREASSAMVVEVSHLDTEKGYREKGSAEKGHAEKARGEKAVKERKEKREKVKVESRSKSEVHSKAELQSKVEVHSRVEVAKVETQSKPVAESQLQPPRTDSQQDPHEWLLEHYTSSPSTKTHPGTSTSPPLPTSVTEPKQLSSPPAPRPPAKLESETPMVIIHSPELKPAKVKSAPAVPRHASVERKAERSVPASSSVDADIDMELGLAVDTSSKSSKKHSSPPKREVSVDMDVDNELLSLLDDEPRPKQHARPRSPPSIPAPPKSPVPPPPSAPSIQPTPKPKLKKPLLEPEQKRATPTPSAASERESMPPPSTTSGTDIAAPGGGKDEGAIAGSSATAKKKEASAKPTTKPKAIPKPKGRTTTAKPKATKSKDTPSGSASTLSPAVAAAVTGGKGKKASPLTTSVSKRAVSIATTGASRSRSTSVVPVAGDVEKKVEEPPEAEEDSVDDKLYCICKTLYDEDRVMIACDRCDEWYHTHCVGMSDTEVDLVDQFICPPCISANPSLNLKTTYKQRCAAGLKHPHPSSSSACHKPSRGAFSKYCSQECGISAMRMRIERWNGDKERLWESVKDAQRREGMVVRCVASETGGELQEVVRPSRTKAEREAERLNAQLDKVAQQRDKTKKELDVLLWREKLVELAMARADSLDECGWDQRLCFGDEEYAEFGPGVLESYEEEQEGMQVDGAQEAGEWWCRGKKKCERHAGWQKLRQAEVVFDKETIEGVLSKLTSEEREIRKRIEDVLETKARAPVIPAPVLQPLNGKGLSNGVVKQKANADGLKKGKKRKEME